MPLTSQQIQRMDLAEFSLLYAQTRISCEVERIIGLILEEQYINKNKILSYYLEEISELYYKPLIDALKLRLSVSSIYIQGRLLYIDWSL